MSTCSGLQLDHIGGNAHYYSCDNLSIEVGGLVVVWSPAHSLVYEWAGPRTSLVVSEFRH